MQELEYVIIAKFGATVARFGVFYNCKAWSVNIEQSLQLIGLQYALTARLGEC